jgi:HSP20 family protein
MQEQAKLQQIPVKIYRTPDRLMVAAPMPGLQPEDIMVEVTDSGHLIIQGEVRGLLKDAKELLLDEWTVGGYYRDLGLPAGIAVDGGQGTITYGNGVLVVALPTSNQNRPARLTLQRVGVDHGIGGSLEELDY